MRHLLRPLIAAAILVISAVISIDSYATLGGDASSVEQDRLALGAQAAATVSVTSDGGSVQAFNNEIVTVKEYLDAKGNVYGVAWRGTTHPDLTVLMGGLYQDYNKASEKHKYDKGKRHSQVSGTNVVVEKSGHMRDNRGKAYIPASLPAGITPEDIQW